MRYLGGGIGHSGNTSLITVAASDGGDPMFVDTDVPNANRAATEQPGVDADALQTGREEEPERDMADIEATLHRENELLAAGTGVVSERDVTDEPGEDIDHEVELPDPDEELDAEDEARRLELVLVPEGEDDDVDLGPDDGEESDVDPDDTGYGTP